MRAKLERVGKHAAGHRGQKPKARAKRRKQTKAAKIMRRLCRALYRGRKPGRCKGPSAMSSRSW